MSLENDNICYTRGTADHLKYRNFKIQIENTKFIRSDHNAHDKSKTITKKYSEFRKKKKENQQST